MSFEQGGPCFIKICVTRQGTSVPDIDISAKFITLFGYSALVSAVASVDGGVAVDE